MNKSLFFLLITFLLGLNAFEANATHGMGGEITWSCQGNGNYVFELTFYRDCNGFDVNTNFETLEVWGHPSLNSIQVDFLSRTDISPSCTPAAGSTPFDCGSGASGGNGIGAVEEIKYRSNPIDISGVPPANGWHFTYQNFSRSGSLTNIQNPTTFGITLTASMFPIPGATGGCIDNSPTFLQSPYVVSCTGEEYEYNPNGIDEDLDSLVFDWGVALDHFPTGNYNPPTNPAPVPFEAGFAYDNPTPDNTFNPNNQAAQLDSENGAIKFTSFTQGNFATKVKVDAYRNGVKIASVEREIQLIVSACAGNNSSPTITPPFAGGTSFETTIFAGDPISFNIVATDVENLQDGTPQSVSISSSGMMYGAGFTNSSNGCITTPCATLNNPPEATGIQGASLGFNWQTSCDHLIDASGQVQDEIPYVFVFKVKDDYCPSPKAKYVTVTINVKNKNVLPAPEITCITTDANGDITINWNIISDPNGDFDSYELFGLAGGSYGTISNINTDSQTLTNVGAGAVDGYYITSNSGCDGNTARSSDTLKNIFLDLNNPGNGEAVLQWNLPYFNQLDYFNDYFHIYKEYPLGTWTLIDSVLYDNTIYKDTITVCEEFINYQIVLPTSKCDFTSNIAGDVFEDKIVPDIPIISYVNIDTLTNDITVVWNENDQTDTYGYVVYQRDLNGNLVEIDTVWGRPNTTFTHSENLENGPFQYSIAAFDSCYTTNVPPTFQTSAKAAPHTTNQLSSAIDACNRELNLNWTGYQGFDTIVNNKIFIRTNGGTWQEIGQTPNNNFSTNINLGDEMIVVIQSFSGNGNTSFSNKDTVRLGNNQGPSMSYLSVATVDEQSIKIKHRVSPNEGAKSVLLYRFNSSIQDFVFLEEQAISNNSEIIFIDNDVEANRRSYTYRTTVIDTCDQAISESNIGKTIFLKVITDESNENHTLQWTPYEDFLGGISSYKVYRSIDDQFDPNPIATLTYNQRSYTDDVSSFGKQSQGKICYYVEAVEASNTYGFEENSRSNVSCGVIQPTIFVPNSFTVGGKNPVFKPETRQIKVDDYLFEVYDRYGRIIFTTTDPAEGWNGELDGQTRIAREGMYVYRLSLRNGDGIEIIKHGSVTLLDYRGVQY